MEASAFLCMSSLHCLDATLILFWEELQMVGWLLPFAYVVPYVASTLLTFGRDFKWCEGLSIFHMSSLCCLSTTHYWDRLKRVAGPLPFVHIVPMLPECHPLLGKRPQMVGGLLPFILSRPYVASTPLKFGRAFKWWEGLCIFVCCPDVVLTLLLIYFCFLSRFF